MYREQLHVKTGCLRCKRRRKKCDEQKPVCGYCSRWRLDCDWPPAPTKLSQMRQGNTPNLTDKNQNLSSTNQYRRHRHILADPRTMTKMIDSLHNLPIIDATQRLKVSGYLHHFFTSMISSALPFDILSAQVGLVHGWARSVFADTAVCYAFAAYCARAQSQRATEGRQKHHSLEFERHAIGSLRQRLLHETQPSESTILVAALHFVIVALENSDARELTRIVKGIGAMLAACGGFARATKKMHSSTMQSVWISDMFCTFLNGTVPVYSHVRRPSSPATLDGLGVTKFCYTELETYCEPHIMSILSDLHFILFFRQPSRQLRNLTAEEASYLYQLHRYTENELGFLQAQHAGAGTLSEVLVMAMVVLKREVIPMNVQHSIIQVPILCRLYAAVIANMTTDPENPKLQLGVLIWACLMALVGAGAEEVRAHFQATVVYLIQLKYSRETWPQDWTIDLRQSLQSMLWHDRLEQRYLHLCDTIKDELQINTVPMFYPTNMSDTG